MSVIVRYIARNEMICVNTHMSITSCCLLFTFLANIHISSPSIFSLELTFEGGLIEERSSRFHNLCCLVFDIIEQSKEIDQHWCPPLVIS
jgi:hypothetical protein